MILYYIIIYYIILYYVMLYYIHGTINGDINGHTYEWRYSWGDNYRLTVMDINDFPRMISLYLEINGEYIHVYIYIISMNGIL